MDQKVEKQLKFEEKWVAAASISAIDFIAGHLPQFSKSQLKKVMNIGGVWLTRKGKTTIMRKAQKPLEAGDQVALYYDEKLLSEKSLTPTCVVHEHHYSVWVKPANMVSQGSVYSDHLSLLRIVEQILNRSCFLVHRLDREVHGLVLIAHTVQAAAAFSAYFRDNRIQKRYQAFVLGHLLHALDIDTPIDGKRALTYCQPQFFDENTNQTLVNISIETGRRHQIRKHLASVGHPIMGDPLYGKGNKNQEGLQLKATELSFFDPWKRKKCQFVCP